VQRRHPAPHHDQTAANGRMARTQPRPHPDFAGGNRPAKIPPAVTGRAPIRPSGSETPQNSTTKKIVLPSANNDRGPRFPERDRSGGRWRASNPAAFEQPTPSPRCCRAPRRAAGWPSSAASAGRSLGDPPIAQFKDRGEKPIRNGCQNCWRQIRMTEPSQSCHRRTDVVCNHGYPLLQRCRLHRRPSFRPMGRRKTACGATLQSIREVNATMTILSFSTVYIASPNFATCKLLLFFCVSMAAPNVEFLDHNR